ncbi:Hypothetical predicted protein [Lecanosticta acicola]|uniref:Uncharacterized protein n=1 Tax=Lecanosticta acicola TaxID=111012 RepID=A0AAI9ED53_9PEZI|nr:Hypothetical predicted protein [Lecanosticta acicola]
MDFNYSKERKVIKGPFHFFDGSFIVEFLEMEEDADCSTLLRATYKANRPLLRKGKQHPQAPPLHLHFDQIETFKILQGVLAVTYGYEQQEVILTPENTPFSIEKMVPHAPYPHPQLSGANGEDVIAILRAHPSAVPNPLDIIWFEHLFKHLDGCHREKKMPDLFQVLLSQHEGASAPVMLPGVHFLGSLRWWVPWKLQAVVAWAARLMGYAPVIQKYLKDE